MGFLDNSGDIILDAVLTDTGRYRLAKGDGSFKISKFALSDDEIARLATQLDALCSRPSPEEADRIARNKKAMHDCTIDELSAALDEEKVMAMLAERAELRRDGMYDDADEVVANLREQYHVILDDKRGTWRCCMIRGGYYRVGPRVDPFTAKKVGDLLERRTEHRVLKEYDEADALHAELSEMGVRLDTRLQTWRLVSPR